MYVGTGGSEVQDLGAHKSGTRGGLQGYLPVDCCRRAMFPGTLTGVCDCDFKLRVLGEVPPKYPKGLSRWGRVWVGLQIWVLLGCGLTVFVVIDSAAFS